MDPYLVLRVDGVSKKYCRDLKKSLWYGLNDIAKEIFQRSGEERHLRPREFWALEDISFQLKQGQSLGLIGGNGAGKTTLLKLINGLIKPSTGRIMVNGSIGALIAFGTGFNPILTGRENIKIAAAVLGFSNKAIKDRMDEIIDFSDIGEFIDAPVKSYSTGMLVRLGFSVAIQLNPDLLLVDEVLAVGDLSFMIKCQKKITEYRNNGGSIILVSHYMHNIRIHCDRAIWINNGRVKSEGPPAKVCNEFEMFTGRTSIQSGNEVYIDAAIKIVHTRYPKVITSDDKFEFELTVVSKRFVKNPIVVFAIFDIRGQHLISSYSNFEGFFPSFNIGETMIKVKFEYLPLSSGIYTVSIILHENEIGNHLAFLQNRFTFEIQNEGTDFGILHYKPIWSITK